MNSPPGVILVLLCTSLFLNVPTKEMLPTLITKKRYLETLNSQQLEEDVIFEDLLQDFLAVASRRVNSDCRAAPEGEARPQLVTRI